jgi:hypothetical protein
MKIAFVMLLLTLGAVSLQAQRTVYTSGGEVSRGRVDATRLSRRIPSVDADRRARVLVGGDSAQRIAMTDFAWRGRVASVELDEEDARVFWDIKIIPDSSSTTIVRYRVDARGGGIMGIREFGGLRFARKP